MDFSLLETMRLDEGTVVRVEGHLARLGTAARTFEYAHDEQRTRAAIAAMTAAHPRGVWRVRLLVSRDGTPTIECTPYVADARQWRVSFSPTPVDVSDRFLYNKTTHRIVYDSARRSRPDADDVILWNEKGEVTESTIANLVAEIDGGRFTPPVACGLLSGVFRRELLESGRIRERVLTREEVTQAPRLWLINSLREWIDTLLV
jgi:para-aminobenzoate synthetase/4-amino-4-deoxychorismate lyase